MTHPYYEGDVPIRSSETPGLEGCGRVAGSRCRDPAPSEPDVHLSAHPAQASHEGFAGQQGYVARS
ncbi:hypothetical protein, partial [Streptomyces lutosisoli]|uniref:hypothetical protein n=1 Tax=Streptomyces lutosisoli TaxID=2665721 RepID=UPI00361BCF33